MPAGILGRRTPRRRRGRPGENQPRVAAIGIESALFAGSTLTIYFDQPVSLKGVPQYTTSVSGAKPVSATMVSPSELNITYDAPLTGATSFSVPYEDPAIRNTAGGYVRPYVNFTLS